MGEGLFFPHMPLDRSLSPSKLVRPSVPSLPGHSDISEATLARNFQGLGEVTNA